MGKDASVDARIAGAAQSGRLQWEAPKLIFRGAERRSWTGSDLTGIAADGDDLVLADGSRFTLGAVQAERWAAAIRNPPGRLDKLGVKPGQRVGLVAFDDPGFAHELATRVAPVEGEGLDLVFTAVDRLADLDRLPHLIDRLATKGAIWIVSPKGKGAAVKDVDVMAAARPLGLVDTKVCSFSDTHTALRFTRRRNPE